VTCQYWIVLKEKYFDDRSPVFVSPKNFPCVMPKANVTTGSSETEDADMSSAGKAEVGDDDVPDAGEDGASGRETRLSKAKKRKKETTAGRGGQGGGKAGRTSVTGAKTTAANPLSSSSSSAPSSKGAQPSLNDDDEAEEGSEDETEKTAATSQLVDRAKIPTWANLSTYNPENFKIMKPAVAFKKEEGSTIDPQAQFSPTEFARSKAIEAAKERAAAFRASRKK